MVRIFGTSGRSRRLRSAIGVAFTLVLLTMFMIPSAQAVHDTGKFQLDGNPSTAAQSTPPADEDWDAICKAHPTTCTQNPSYDFTTVPATTATRSAFITDAFLSASDNIYKGGTDDADVNTWLWKQAGPSPDKDDIEHAFAAEYTVTAVGPYQGHKVLFFGGDRLANNGATNIGLWFFQNAVGTGGSKTGVDANGNPTCGVNSGCGFSGTHKVGNKSLGGSTAGDLFILSAFTNGGAQPNIRVFEWVGPGNATKDYLGTKGCFTSACTLQPLAIPNTPGFSDNRCDGTDVTGDPACAIVNPGGEMTPWTFTDKTSGAPANTHGSSELYEGGLDLSGLGFGEACFSTVLLNTRSSPSGTSALQDFAIGSFGSCTSSITTTPQAGDGGAIPSTIGTSARVEVRDHADITVSGISGAFHGTVKFYLCGPLALTTTTNCATNGVQIGDPAAGEDVNGAGGTASVNSDTATLTSAGRYCWRAEYSGDTTAQVPGSKDPSKSVADGGTTSECFSIGPVIPTLTTTAGADVILGNAIGDTASLTGTAKQPGTDGVGPGGTINATAGTQANAGGTIAFDVRGPGPGAGSCTASGLTVNGSPVTVSGDNTSYGPVTATPTAIGTYTFVATYNGSSPNTNGAAGSCPPGANDGDEEVTVTGVATLATNQKWLPNDRAHVTGSTGTTLSGSVIFTLYNDGTCGVDGGTSQYTVTRNIVTDADASPAPTNSDRYVSTTNTGFFVTTANDAVAWSWKVSYDDANLTDPAPKCESTTPAFTLSD